MRTSTEEQVLQGALSWIDRHLDYFDPFEDGRLSGLCEIPLAELAILVLCAIRPSGRTRTKIIEKFLDFLEDIHHRPEYWQRPFRAPETLVSHVIVAAALAHSGRISRRSYRAPFKRLVLASTLMAPALPPHRQMELRHALDVAGVSHALPSFRQLYLKTLAAYEVNPIMLTKDEAYVITHVLFYAADLGQRAPLGLIRGDIERLRKLVNQLLGMYISARNWDLTAELISSSHCLRSVSQFDSLGWKCIRSSQHSDGAIPGPRYEQAKQTQHSGRKKRIVEACYHTTVVSAMAALVSLHAARA